MVRRARQVRYMLFSMVVAGSVTSGALPQNGAGVWDEPLDWEYWIAERLPSDPNKLLFESSINDCNPPGEPCAEVGKGNREWELSHAVVFPTGLYAGWVGLWRLEIAVEPPGEPEHIGKCFKNTSRIWLINPADPATPLAIVANFDNDIFCAGQSWDKTGQLVIGGGVTGGVCTEPGLGEFPAHTYRFKPSALTIAQAQYPPATPPLGYFSDEVVVNLADGSLGRYYPLMMPLFNLETYFAGVVTPLPGGTNMLIGGPPGIDEPYGNEVWELIQARTTDWELPMVPVDPTGTDPVYASSSPFMEWQTNSPLYTRYGPPGFNQAFLSGIHTYERDATLFPDRLLDSYPRTYQLPGGEMLIWGDVNTAAEGANDPGMTWVIRPDFDPSTSQQDGWKSYLGKEGTGNGGGGAWHDSFYDSGVLLQELDAQGTRQARILMFGGSREVAPDNWVVNDEIWQFSADVGSAFSATDGDWFLKFEGIPTDPGSWIPPGSTYPAFKRMYANAVILPTGQVFVVGGTSVDDYAGQAGHEQGPTAPVPPIIYDPGDPNPDQLIPESDGVVYPQPSTYGPQNISILPRLYHSTAVLLPDGRVLCAGGKRTYGGQAPPFGALEPPEEEQLAEKDPRYSGQIFSPPYLDLDTTQFGSRPVIETVDSPIDLGSTFTVEVTRRCDRTIDAIVLMRPAALTHHFDSDQRYVELVFNSTSSPCSSGTNYDTEIFTATAPDADEVPPGYYMIFAVETDGTGAIGHRVPSIGTFVKLRN